MKTTATKVTTLALAGLAIVLLVTAGYFYLALQKARYNAGLEQQNIAASQYQALEMSNQKSAHSISKALELGLINGGLELEQNTTASNK